MAKPIVAMSFNVARFDNYNLALRLRHAGYTNVYWYRGGREAWEVAGKPKTWCGRRLVILRNAPLPMLNGRFPPNMVILRQSDDRWGSTQAVKNTVVDDRSGPS